MGSKCKKVPAEQKSGTKNAEQKIAEQKLNEGIKGDVSQVLFI